MNRHAWLVSLLVAVVLLGACGPDSRAGAGRETGLARSPLVAPGATPIPHDGKNKLWDGNTVQLLFADALASCSWSDMNEHMRQVLDHDEYMTQVVLKMRGVTCHGKTIGWFVSPDWIALRAMPECNRDPSSSAPQAVTVEPRSILTHENMDGYGFDHGESWPAILDLITPSINLCIAQKLRALSPGASGAEAILMSEAEQRELVAATLERAQRAMLGLSVLGLALMPSPSDGQVAPPNGEARVAVLRAWAQDPAKRPLVAQLGVDLAAAIELHSVLAVEMAEMLARSASAKAPRGGGAASDAEEIWGPGSWRQRAMALLFGGYPLAEEPDGTAPWTEPTRKLSGSSVFGESWPPHWLAPFARHDVREPEAHLFRSLTGLLPRIDVRLDPTSGSRCFLVDVDKTAEGLRQAVLKALDPGGPCDGLACGVKQQDPSAPDELWRRHRIRPEHVRSYARYLADMLEPVCVSQSQGVSLSSGFTDLDGDVAVAKGPGLGVRVLSTAAFVPKQIEQRAAVFARAMPWRMPDAIYTSVASWRQGFAYLQNVAGWQNAAYERMGHVGALSAQLAVREALRAMESLASTSTGAAAIRGLFAQHERRMLEVIRATAGESSLALRPFLLPQQDGLLAIPAGQPGRTSWAVDVARAESDAWWALGPGDQMWVVPFHDEPWAAGLARFPARKAFGRSIDDLANAVTTSAASGAGRATLLSSSGQSGLRRYRAMVGLQIGGEGAFGLLNTHRITLVAQKRLADGRREYRLVAADLAPPYAPVIPDQGTYIGSGGRLGEVAARLLRPQAQNPTQPELDGFGLRTSWVPPTDASMFGASPGQTAVAYYLASAESAAKEASAAVDSAMSGLLEQQKDAVALGAATLRAAEVNRLEEASLCGENNPACGQGAQTVELPALAWNPQWSGSDEFRECPGVPPQGFPPVNAGGFEGHDKATFEILKKVYSDYAAAGRPADAQSWSKSKYSQVPGECLETIGKGLQMLIGIGVSAAGKGGADLAPKVTVDDLVATGLIHCHALQALSAVTGPATGTPGGGATVAIAKAVADVRDAATQPSFGEYAGGSLQGAFIEQWAALRLLRNLADEYMLAVAAAEAKVLAARVAANTAAALYHASCNPQKASEAERSCWSFTLGIPSYNSGPIVAYNQTCEVLAAQVGPQIMAAHAEQAEAMARVSSYASKFTDAVKNAHLASAKVSQLTLSTKLAKARNELEVDLTAMQQVTTSGLYTRFHSYDLWRAKALVESARRQAVAARRTVESRFAVDLSTMKASEPFVAPPATWADEVYAYDLSLPAAVGLSIGNAEPGGIYPNKLADYVGNLRRFVEGYAVARPSASASEDTEVLSIPGPYVRSRGTEDGAAPDQDYPDPRAMRWEVYCPATSKWVRLVDLVPTSSSLFVLNPDMRPVPRWNEKPCGAESPTKARAPLQLDPWGRLEGSIANEPYETRYNVRWARLAVNLVGTGIKDCKKANDPAACYAEPYVRYDLWHIGPAWVSGYDQEWHLFAIPTGRIEGAKGVAAEQWVDPLTTSFSKPYLEAASRRELADRPLGGAYVLEIDLGPETRLDRIERVQILAATTYWVRQQ